MAGKRYVEYVQGGFHILRGELHKIIKFHMKKNYKNPWDEILSTLKYPTDLKKGGDFQELVDTLDDSPSLLLIQYKAKDFAFGTDEKDCRTWATELVGVRNKTAHIGASDFPQEDAERYLDTMHRLCLVIDKQTKANAAAQIKVLYDEVRSKADAKKIGPTVVEAPKPGVSTVIKPGTSLLDYVGTDAVQLTTLTRKVTFNGVTKAYPVYSVRLDALYYNDQNDRIATWITQYRAEHGDDALAILQGADYNDVIEDFIVASNPEAIKKTQNDISMRGQKEPGVTLADGRIVDGNRRFSCLRRIHRDKGTIGYFETVIMDVDIEKDQKQIKLLELAIQHGEEKKVDYDKIEYAIGTYRDVVQTKLLTEEEYASSANEKVAEVKKRIECAVLVREFLEYLRLDEQYHIARECQVYSVFLEMLPALKKLKPGEQDQLKTIAFNNALLKAVVDQRQFIRDIKKLIDHKLYSLYFQEQMRIHEEIVAAYADVKPAGKADLDKFAEEHTHIAEELQRSLEKALLRLRSAALHSKPAENLEKCMDLILEIDPRLLKKMGPEEKKALKAAMDELIDKLNGFSSVLDTKES